jgi:hypothetical protein
MRRRFMVLGHDGLAELLEIAIVLLIVLEVVLSFLLH